MANPNKAFLTGTEQVLNWFDTNAKKPYWSIVDAKGVVIYAFTDDDMHESRQSLEDNLIAAVSAGITATLTLRIHPKKPKEGYFKNGSESMIATYFRPVEFEIMPYNNSMSGNNIQLSNQLAAMESKINALQMQLAQEDEEEDDEEEEDKGILGTLMGNPAVKQMMMNVISNLLTTAPKTNVTNLAGIETDISTQEYTEEDDKIDEAIERLKKHDPKLGDDLLKLCSIAENDPAQFNMLLKMLRM